MLRKLAFVTLGSLLSATAPAQGILPIVTGASENSAATQIVISGVSFGTALPGVTLGGTSLKVLTASASSITAQLPATLAPGSYLLTVVNNNTHLPAIFEVTLGAQGLTGAIGAMGLPGPQGIPGPQGLPGPQGTPGLQGAAGLPGAPGAQGAAGATGTAGSAGGQVWSASFTMPLQLTAAAPPSGWNQVKNCSSGCPTTPPTGPSVPVPTVASPSGSGLAIALMPNLTANTAIAFLTIPATCTAYNLNAYVIGAQTSSYGATISLSTADPFNDVITGTGAPQLSPTTTALYCQIAAGQGGNTQQCTSSGTAASLLPGGELVTMVVSPADTSNALAGAQILTTFSCDSTNTTGTITAPIGSGWNRVKNVQD